MDPLSGFPGTHNLENSCERRAGKLEMAEQCAMLKGDSS